MQDRKKSCKRGLTSVKPMCYDVSVGRANAPKTEAEGARKEAPMQHQSKAGSDKVIVKIKTTVTVETTITITEANKKAACRCCESCKR